MAPVAGLGPLGVGVIGFGAIGRTHARACEGIADLSLRARTGGPIDHPLPQVSVAELLADPAIDVVAVCSPSGLHAEHALAAVRAGKHVVVEKPLAISTADAEKVLAAATAADVRVIAVAQRRLESQNREIHRLLHSGALGLPVLTEALVHWHRDDAYYSAAPWRSEPGQGAGSLPNQGLHSLDLLLWFMGPVTSVTAQQATLGHDLPFEDTTTATLRFASGALGIIVTTTAAPPGLPATLALFTDTGSFELTHDSFTRWTFADVEAPTSGAATTTGATDPAAIGIAGHVQLWRDVASALQRGCAPELTGAEGLNTVRVIEAIERSAASGSMVTL